MGDVPSRVIGSEDSTPVQIHVAELRQREREHRQELEKHDGKIETLQVQVAELRVQVRTQGKVQWFGISTLTALILAGFSWVLRLLHR